MKSRSLASMALLNVAVMFITGSSVLAQSNPRYIRFSGVPPSVKGAFYQPDAPQPAPHVAFS